MNVLFYIFFSLIFRSINILCLLNDYVAFLLVFYLLKQDNIICLPCRFILIFVNKTILIPGLEKYMKKIYSI